jgi:primosomal protein N' (replication factor Y)
LAEVLKIIVPLNLDKEFTYKHYNPNQELSELIGKRVLIEFNKKVITGLVIAIDSQEELSGINEILDVLDEKPIIDTKRIELLRWIAMYYIASLGDTLKLFLPEFLNLRSRLFVKVNTLALFKNSVDDLQKSIRKVESNVWHKYSEFKESTKLNDNEIDYLYEIGSIDIKETLKEIQYLPTNFKVIIFENLQKTKLSPTLKRVYKYFINKPDIIHNSLILNENKITTKSVKLLESLGLIELVEVRNELQTNSIKYTLTKEQSKVYQNIHQSSNQLHYIWGVTGSGKTIIYFQLILDELNRGNSSLVIVPEIFLSSQLFERFNKVFPNQVAIFHSRLNPKERKELYFKIVNKELKVVLGARSSLFINIPNLSLIIVDEEFDSSYKQDNPSPRYNARDVAIVLSKLINAKCILGSATPSVESFSNFENGTLELHKLNERINKNGEVNVKLIDMVSARNTGAIKQEFSEELYKAIVNNRENLTMLFQNRKAYSLYHQCSDCGVIETCDNCDTTLTYYKNGRYLKCNYCNFIKKVSNVCNLCGSTNFDYLKYGNEKIEEDLNELFPKLKIVKIDSDSIKRSKDLTLLNKSIAEGKFNIILGTQIIAKGLDFRNLLLLGVLGIDSQLFSNDFRAKEKCYQLLSQIIGRVARYPDEKGLVLIQTNSPNNELFNFVIEGKTKEFLENELLIRKKSDLPPHSRMITIELLDTNVQRLEKTALAIYTHFPRSNYYDFFEPITPNVRRINNYYRSLLLFKIDKQKDKSGKKFSNQMKNYLIENKEELSRLRIRINVDFINNVI